MPSRPSSRYLCFSLAVTLCVLCTASVQAESLQPSPSQKIAASTLSSATPKPLPEPVLEPIEINPSLAPEQAPPPKTTPLSENEADNEPLKARAVVVDIQSDTLNYNKDTDLYTATGSAHVVISEQNSELTADKVIYDQTKGLLFAEGHVVIIKNGRKTEGVYAKIDLNRESALINDAVTTVQAVRIKAKEALVDSNYVQLENGKFIINGKYLAEIMSRSGSGLGGLNTTGKKANQSRLNRQYYQQIRSNQQLLNQIDPNLVATNKALETQTLDFSEDKKSRFQLKVKEIDVTRGEDGYDKIRLKYPSIFMGKFKLATMPANEFSYDENVKQIQYLGPDIGFNTNYGGFYGGPGWDFHVGKSGSVRFSPLLSFGGNPYQFGQTQKPKGNGPGIGGIVHYRDPATYLDLAYNSHVGYPVMFADRRLFGETTHFMAAYRDVYQNGLIGTSERPNYIAQITDYRVLKQFKNFQLTSFESMGYAKDNFTPTNSSKFFVDPTSAEEQTAGRIQLQAQLQNVQPLLRVGPHLSFGFRGLLAFAGYTTKDYVGLARMGPTMNLNLLGGRLNSSMGYNLTASTGQSPFVFDSYYGGSQNLTLNNTFRFNDYLTIGTSNSLNLLRDNAKKALAVGNSLYFLVGPKDVKLNLAFDFISKRSYFGINFYPGGGNTVINFDRLKMYQPQNYSGQFVP